MFDKEKIKKLISFDWKNMYDKAMPNNEKDKYTNEEFEDIRLGSIIMLIASIVITLCSVFVITSLVSSIFKSEDVFGIKTAINFASNMGSTSLFPIIILVYIYIFKEREHSSLIEFIAGIVLIIVEIFYVISSAIWIAAMFINPVWALLGLIAQLAFVYGVVLVLDGIIPFCLRIGEKTPKKEKKESLKEKKESKKSSLNYCSSCGTKVTGLYCTNCGKKIK